MSFLTNRLWNAARTVCKIIQSPVCASQTQQTQLLSHSFAKHSHSRHSVSSFRNMWTMSRNTTVIANSHFLNKSSRTCNLHTEGDKELSEFLMKEINLEQSTTKFKSKLPDIKDFTVTTDGSDIVFTKTGKDETLVVKFNINHSVDADEPLQMDEKQDGDDVAHFVSKPPFTVDLTKSGGETLSVHCNFPTEDEFDDDPDAKGQSKTEETFTDQYEIQEVAIHRGEMNETVYSIGADTMDGTLYDLLMDMLDERGINDEFIDSLVDYSTTYEHKQYVKFLSELKSFVEK